MPPRTPPPDRARGSANLHRSSGNMPRARRVEQPDDGRYRSRGERNFELPKGIAEELRAGSADAPARARRAPVTLERRMANAAMAYERDRYQDALSALKPVLDAAPGSASVRELHGLILYRLGRWRSAAKELREFHALSGSYDQHPVIADCSGRWVAMTGFGCSGTRSARRRRPRGPCGRATRDGWHHG